jgi:hypothetical protein
VSEVFERRAHPRYAVDFTVRCRRLGPRQRQRSDDVRVVDVSLGGMCIEAPSWMDIGNVLEVEGDGIAMRALVVGISSGSPASGDEPRGRPSAGATRHAHVAFSSVNGPAIDLDRVLGPRARAS